MRRKADAHKPSLKERQRIEALLAEPLVKGECREVRRCLNKSCRAIYSHDFVPFGLGVGRWTDACLHVRDDRWAKTELLAERGR